MKTRRFHDRREAGRELANRLRGYSGEADLIVLALPRGGVPVAFEIAQWLQAPLDVFIVRKLGLPQNEEVAMGAIASGGTQLLNTRLIERYQIAGDDIDRIVEREQKEMERREKAYRQNRPPLNLHDKTVLLIDDGLATGATMSVAIRAVRKLEPARIIAAAPVGAADACLRLRSEADEVICLVEDSDFGSVSRYYDDFTQTTDEEVRLLLEAANR